MIFEAKKDKLIFNHKIEVRKSKLHGYGVFANEFIKKGEILEECHLIEVGKSSAKEYVFSYPKGDIDDILQGTHDFESEKFVLPTGFGTIYNTAKDAYGANANWVDGDNVFIFKAVKDIKKDEEILTNYSAFLYNRNPDHNEMLYMKMMDERGLKRTKPKPTKK